MDSKKAEALRKKYWEGKTSQSEEKELKNHFSGAQGGSDLDDKYFSYLNKESAEDPLDDKFNEEILSLIDDKNHEIKQNISLIKYWYIAASFLLSFQLASFSKMKFSKWRLKNRSCKQTLLRILKKLLKKPKGRCSSYLQC